MKLYITEENIKNPAKKKFKQENDLPKMKTYNIAPYRHIIKKRENLSYFTVLYNNS